MMAQTSVPVAALSAAETAARAERLGTAQTRLLFDGFGVKRAIRTLLLAIGNVDIQADIGGCGFHEGLSY